MSNATRRLDDLLVTGEIPFYDEHEQRTRLPEVPPVILQEEETIPPPHADLVPVFGSAAAPMHALREGLKTEMGGRIASTILLSLGVVVISKMAASHAPR